MSTKLKNKPKTINDKTTLIQIRIKPVQKDKLDNIFDQLGMTTTQAISMFLSEVERTNKIPLNLDLNSTTLKNETTSKDNIYELTDAQIIGILKSKEDIKNGKFKIANNREDIENIINSL
jgi:DNA-damage-inducible protein J